MSWLTELLRRNKVPDVNYSGMGSDIIIKIFDYLKSEGWKVNESKSYACNKIDNIVVSLTYNVFDNFGPAGDLILRASSEDKLVDIDLSSTLDGAKINYHGIEEWFNNKLTALLNGLNGLTYVTG